MCFADFKVLIFMLSAWIEKPYFKHVGWINVISLGVLPKLKAFILGVLPTLRSLF